MDALGDPSFLLRSLGYPPFLRKRKEVGPLQARYPARYPYSYLIWTLTMAMVTLRTPIAKILDIADQYIMNIKENGYITCQN